MGLPGPLASVEGAQGGAGASAGAPGGGAAARWAAAAHTQDPRQTRQRRCCRTGCAGRPRPAGQTEPVAAREAARHWVLQGWGPGAHSRPEDRRQSPHSASTCRYWAAHTDLSGRQQARHGLCWAGCAVATEPALLVCSVRRRCWLLTRRRLAAGRCCHWTHAARWHSTAAVPPSLPAASRLH